MLTDHDSKMGYRFPHINYLVSTLTKTAESFGWMAARLDDMPKYGNDTSHSRCFGALWFHWCVFVTLFVTQVSFLSLGRRWRSTWHAWSKRNFCVGWVRNYIFVSGKFWGEMLMQWFRLTEKRIPFCQEMIIVSIRLKRLCNDLIWRSFLRFFPI
jgi:hypothetical protein